MTDGGKGEVVDEVAIPLVEERLTIGKRPVAGRTVSVTTRPVTETQTIREPVMRERVSVERVPVGRVVEAIPEIQETDDLTIIPVVEERIVVTKQLVLTEEIHLRRTREQGLSEHSVELLRTEVDISDQEERQP